MSKKSEAAERLLTDMGRCFYRQIAGLQDKTNRISVPRGAYCCKADCSNPGVMAAYENYSAGNVVIHSGFLAGWSVRYARIICCADHLEEFRKALSLRAGQLGLQ